MLVEGKFTLKAPIQDVWDFLMAPGTLVSCIPGAEKFDPVDDKTWEGIVKQRVGPISVKLNFTETFTEIDPPKHVKAAGRGVAAGNAGTFTQETIVDLAEIGNGEVEIAYSSDVNLVGKLATFGERIMRTKVKSTVEDFINNLQTKLKDKMGG